MQLVDNQQILDYVAAEFSTADCQTLLRIHQGGLNNTKGRDYENYFQLFKAFEIAAQDNCNLDKQILGMQVLGFVDDICHIDGDNLIKYNYQAKNSSGSAANWTVDISDRFKKQRAIDAQCYKMQHTQNCLLVSDKNKAVENLTKIPADLKHKDTCQYFAYHQTLVELVYNTALSSYISKLIINNNRSNIDYAAKLILGVLQANQYRSVADIFTQAQADGHPNPFIKFRSLAKKSYIPPWIQQILTKASQHIAYRLECNILTITSTTGLVISVDIDLLNQLPDEQIAQIHTIQDLLRLSMRIAAQNLQQHLSSSDNGAI